MTTRPITALAIASSVLLLTLASCSHEQSPNGATGDISDSGLSTAIDTGRMVVSFLSTAPAGKTLGGGRQPRAESPKDRKDADKQAKKAQEEADRLAAAADRQAAKATKEDRNARKEADRLTAAADRLAAQAQKQADRLAAQRDGHDDASSGPGDALTVSAVIGPDGGTLEIRSEGEKRGSNDDVRVMFIVPEGSLTAPVEIVMTVEGRFLSELKISFGPDGTSFDPPAKLRIHLGKDLLDLDPFDITATHEHGDEEETVVVETSGRSVRNYRLELDVTGFSRYSLGN